MTHETMGGFLLVFDAGFASIEGPTLTIAYGCRRDRPAVALRGRMRARVVRFLAEQLAAVAPLLEENERARLRAALEAPAHELPARASLS